MTLEEFAKAIETLRTTALFGGPDPLRKYDSTDEVCTAALDLFAEQEFLQALSFLDLAHRAATKADYHQARALAQSPYRGWNEKP